MILFKRWFKTSEELREFLNKVIEYGQPFFVICMYTEDGKEYIEYGKDDGKEGITKSYAQPPWDE